MLTFGRILLSKILLFIPLIWITYLFGGDFLIEFILRIILCFLALGIFTFMCKFLYKKKITNSTIVEESINEKYQLVRHNKFLRPVIALCIIIGTGITDSYKLLSSEYNRFRILDVFILFIFVFIITGNPFLEKYVGVNEEMDEVVLEESKKTLFPKSIFESKDLNGDFYEYGSYTTQRFIFKETGYLKGFYMYGENTNHSFQQYLDVLKISGIALFYSFLEATIKSCIWVSFIYILFGLPYYLKIEREKGNELTH